MNIAVDVSMVNLQMAGIGYYAYELTKALIAEDTANSYTLYTNNVKDLPEDLVQKAGRIAIIPASKPGFSWLVKASRHMKQNNIDLCISPSNFMLGVFFKNTIQIVHDLVPLKHPEFWPRKATLMYKFQLLFASKRVKRFVTISRATESDLVHYFPSTKTKTAYIGAGLHEWTNRIPVNDELHEVKKKLNLPDPFFLSLSTLEPRKNHVGMIKAFSVFHKENPDYYYLIAGKKGWYYDHIFETVKEMGVEKHVRFLGYVAEELLPPLLALSKGLLFVSFDEGFGLPPLEAAKFGIPVLTTDIPVMRETMQNYAVLVDPHSVEDMAEGMNELLFRKQTHNKTYFNQYTWKKVGTRLMNQYELFQKVKRS